jgi:hypothetical protein
MNIEDRLIDELEAMDRTDAAAFLINNPEITAEIGLAFANMLDNERRDKNALACEQVLESHYLNLRDEYPDEAEEFIKQWNKVLIITPFDTAPVVDT